MSFHKIVTLIIFSLYAINSWAQGGLSGQDSSRRVITTAVPFMVVAPDARAGAMGDVGVATSPDANSVHWNVSKLAMIEKRSGVSLSYTPWLSKLISDMSITYLSGFYKINNEQAVGGALRYFDMGSIQFTDDQGNDLQQFNPYEFSFEGSYARLLSDNMSIGLTMKFIYSNLVGNAFIPNSEGSQAAISVAADLGWYWNKDLMLGGTNSNLALGASITNIGSKMTYSNDDNLLFVPTNLRLGSSLKMDLDPYNSITISLDFNKLMVPTPPVYEVDETGTIVTDPDGNPVIRRGKDPNRNLLSGMFGSFSDAPDGFQEELQEVMIGGGVEYWYNELFAARVGYFYEHQNKGNRKYLTMGVGLRYNIFGIDFAYLVPQQQNHPLAETLRFTLLVNFDQQQPAESIRDIN